MKVLHLLNWKLENIKKELPRIKSQGFDTIQINPMQPFKEEHVFHWWLSYQPLGFRIGNMFGSKEDLKSLCGEAKKFGIDIIVDVVLNHTANAGPGKELIPHPSVDKILLSEKPFWKTGEQIVNYNDRFDTTHNMNGLPGLNLNNKELQSIVFNFLNELKECGVKGFRFDAAKHIGLPKDGVNFFIKVRDYLKNNNLKGYAEFLGGTKEWRDEMSDYLMVLSPSCNLITNEDKFITFIDGHDTVLNEDGCTKEYTKEDLLIYYKLLRLLYENTICYVRPNLDIINPYYKNENNLSMKQVYNLNERDFFDTFYIDDNRIKDVHALKKIYK